MRSHHEVSRLRGRATTACPPNDEVAAVHAQGNALQAFSSRPMARERHGRLLIGAFELFESAKLLLPVALVAVDCISICPCPHGGGEPRQSLRHRGCNKFSIRVVLFSQAVGVGTPTNTTPTVGRGATHKLIAAGARIGGANPSTCGGLDTRWGPVRLYRHEGVPRAF